MKRCAFLGVGLVMALTFAGCPLAPMPGLVGDWRMVYDDGFEETWVFFQDGTFEWYDEDGLFGGEGTWTRNGLEVTAMEMFEADEGTYEVTTEIMLAASELSLTGSLTEFLDGVEEDTFTFTGTKQ